MKSKVNVVHMYRTIVRGDIFDADIPEVVIGSEQAGRRPVVIIQADWLNRTSSNVKFAVITSKLKRLELPTHYLIPDIRGLPKQSMVLGEHTGTMDKSRLLGYRCTLGNEIMRQVDKAVRASIKDKKPKRSKRYQKYKKKKPKRY